MTDRSKTSSTRRDFLKTTGTIAAASTLVAGSIPAVHAQGSETINVALVGCGGRGTGAAANAMQVNNGPTKLLAMADVFEDRMKVSHASLSKQFEDQVDVPQDRQFLGFDAYKNAIDVLGPGDVVIFTTPLAFRWVHFTYAIEKGVNVFMEKPVIADGPSARRMLELGKKAEEKNLKVAVGLMCRHCKARQAAAERIHNGDIGDVIALRAYRMAGPTGSAATGPRPDNIETDLEWQIRRFHGFLWASGGAVSDFLIHNIDEACWVKDDWPISAKACGGRHYRGDMIDQNFDSYSLEYTFADGTKLDVQGRTIPGCHQDFATYAYGENGSAIFSTRGHVPASSRLYYRHNFVAEEMKWMYPDPEPNPYQVEWNDLIAAIKNDDKYSELERGVKSSVATSMGRMAAHTGQIITYDGMLNCEHEFAPDVDKMTYDSKPPVELDANGKYPIPLPGLNQDREYA